MGGKIKAKIMVAADASEDAIKEITNAGRKIERIITVYNPTVASGKIFAQNLMNYLFCHLLLYSMLLP